jgi:hypothetical protein
MTNKVIFKDRVQIHVYIDRDLQEWAAQEAFNLHISLAAYIRGLIEEKKNE